jgi:hypothetical protein
MLPLPLPDDQGRCVMLMRNGVYPPELKITDIIKVNMMISDILLEENDRLVICGSVNVLDHEKNTLAHMVQFSPAVVKKMTTLFQVMVAEPPLAIHCPRDCYIFKGTSTRTESLAQIVL